MNEISIIYEDESILIIDKPSGITVNRAVTTRNEFTIQDWVENYFRFEVRADTDFYKRAGIVHRIDKETSGLLVIAKEETGFINLQAQFKDRRVRKTYLALVHGIVSPSHGDISVPVGRLPWNRKRFGVLAGGKESVTEYKVLSNYSLKGKKTVEQLTLLELNPKTGRTHQIRVHLKYINHPIFADLQYAGRKTARSDRKLLPRVFLHAQKIIFYHPVTNSLIKFESPFPKELDDLLTGLQSQA